MKNKSIKLNLGPQLPVEYALLFQTLTYWWIFKFTFTDIDDSPVHQSVDIVSKFIQKHDVVHSYRDNIIQSLSLECSSAPL